MTAQRLNRDQFSARLAPLDDPALRKVPCTLYWRRDLDPAWNWSTTP